LGLYVEPGIRYYMDNGSAVRNYFKDKPTNVTLQMGLQLNIGNKRH
jgi:invasion protein IalB